MDDVLPPNDRHRHRLDLLKQIQPALDSVEQGDVADVAGQ